MSIEVYLDLNEEQTDLLTQIAFNGPMPHVSDDVVVLLNKGLIFWNHRAVCYEMPTSEHIKFCEWCAGLDGNESISDQT